MRTILLLLLFIAMQFGSNAQKAEKIYIHTDKDFYLPGETVWFKTYMLEYNSISSKTNLFAGLYDENGKLLVQKNYPIFNGTAAGDFLIPDSTPQSQYQLRVYTKNKEISADNDLIIPLRVYQKNKLTSAAVETGLPGTAIFIEGGRLVSGVNNHIVLKNRQANAAAIIDESGKLVDSVFFEPGGYSKLQLTPQAGKRYFISWKNNNGQEQKIEMPPAQTEAVALHTELSGNKLYYSVYKSSNSEAFKLLRLSIKEGNETVYSEELKMGDKLQFVNSFATDSLGTGIYTVLLTDVNNQLQQQKLLYLPGRQHPVSIQVKQQSAAPKGKNVVEIKVNDSSLTSWSASVVDEKFYLPSLQTSIYDALIPGQMSTDLSHNISQPKKAEMLLVTYPVINSPALAPNDNYLSVSAQQQRSIHKGISLSLVIADKASGKQFYNLNQAAPGNFVASGLLYYDSAKVYYQLSDKELTQGLSVLAPAPVSMPVSIAPVKNTNWLQQLANKEENLLEEVEEFIQQKPAKFNEEQTISTVVVKSKYVNPVTKRILELDDKYATGMFKGLARGQQLNVVDDPTAQHMFDLFSYLPYRASGVSVSRNSEGAKIFVSRSGPFVVFVDEVETPVELIENISMSRIAYVKVINGIVAGSSFTTDAGAIYIYTKKGDEDRSSLTMKSIMTKGYDIPAEFLNPDYSDPKSPKPADYRTTLYWNPYIFTDKTNNSFTIEFFNNDASKGKVLKLVGLNANGEPVEVEKRLE